MPRKRPPARNPPPPIPFVVEVFDDLDGRGVVRQVDHIVSGQPHVWNGEVSVVKYRITIERVEEPTAVIHARLQKLWEESDSHHQSDPLRTEARRHGYELVGPRGSARKR